MSIWNLSLSNNLSMKVIKELNNFYIPINYEARASWLCFKYFLRTKIAEMTPNILTNAWKIILFFFKYFHTKKWRTMMHEMCSLTTFLHSSNNSCTIYSINSKESEREGSVFGCMMWCEWWLKPHFYFICLMIICLKLPLF